MATLRLLLPSGRALAALDVALALWVAAWLWLGIAVGHQVSGLRNLSATVTQVGSALQQTGSTLDGLSSLPVVGEQIGTTARQVQEAGRQTAASGRASRSSVRNLSWMLALAIAVIPSVPVLGFYFPLRVLALRERRRFRVMLERHGTDPEFRRYLAHRALFTLPYAQLARVAPEPWREYAEGRFDQLAALELERAGLTSPPR